MRWYYHTNILCSETSKSPLATQSSVKQQPLIVHPSAHPYQTPPVISLKRYEVEPASNYATIQELVKVKKELAKHGLHKGVKEVQTLIRDIKIEDHYEKRKEIPDTRREIKDKANNLVGILYLAETPEMKKDTSIGDNGFVLRPTFYFRRTTSGRGYVLKARAELTKEGLTEVIRYTKQVLKKRFARIDFKTLRKIKQKSNAEINRILSRTDTQGLVVNGINVHVNFNGSMDVFVPVSKGLEVCLEEYNSDGNNRIRLVRTNPEMNATFVDAFNALALVVSGITER
ncbi:MAG: hypothetical protein AABW91_04040 [Nanoarchaeota archaeon]